MKTLWLWGTLVVLGLTVTAGCANPCEILFSRCVRCTDRIQEDRCKSTSAFNHWGACGTLLDEFSQQNVCQESPTN